MLSLATPDAQIHSASGPLAEETGPSARQTMNPLAEANRPQRLGVLRIEERCLIAAVVCNFTSGIFTSMSRRQKGAGLVRAHLAHGVL